MSTPRPLTPLPRPDTASGQWLAQVRAEALRDEPAIHDNELRLYLAVAAVESGWGQRAIVGPQGRNEIGYKAIAGKPSVELVTHEAAAGQLVKQTARFRLFANRAEQLRSFLWLIRQSSHYVAARRVQAQSWATDGGNAWAGEFYHVYAPGRDAGRRAVLRIYEALAANA